MAKERTLTAPVALSCDTIGDGDSGIARHLVDAELQKAVDDLMDRGEEDGKTRMVNLSVELGLHNGIVFWNVAAQAKLPPRKSKNTAAKVRMKAKGQHELLFQADNADNPDQPVFGIDGEVDADE